MFDYPDAGHCHGQVYKIVIQCTFDYFELLIHCFFMNFFLLKFIACSCYKAIKCSGICNHRYFNMFRKLIYRKKISLLTFPQCFS